MPIPPTCVRATYLPLRQSDDARFVHCRKKTSKLIRDMAIEKETIAQFVKPEGATSEILLEKTNNVKDPNLKDLLQFGFVIHHAGMSREDHGLVEVVR